MGTVVSCPEADQHLGNPLTLQVQTLLMEVVVTENKTNHHNTAMSLFACINMVTEGATTPNNSVEGTATSGACGSLRRFAATAAPHVKR